MGREVGRSRRLPSDESHMVRIGQRVTCSGGYMRRGVIWSRTLRCSRGHIGRNLQGPWRRLKPKSAVQSGPYRRKVYEQRGQHGPGCRRKRKDA